MIYESVMRDGGKETGIPGNIILNVKF